MVVAVVAAVLVVVVVVIFVHILSIAATVVVLWLFQTSKILKVVCVVVSMVCVDQPIRCRLGSCCARGCSARMACRHGLPP